MRRAHAIATRAAALAIIAGTGLTPLLAPIAAHADTTSTQPSANTNDKNETRAQFTVDKTRVFKYDGTHKTLTCLSADYPKEVVFYSQEQTSQPNTDAAANAKLTATDITTTIDGRTIKGKAYNVTTGTGEKLTLNCYKAGDFFANLKVTWNGVQATINPYGADGVNDDTANQYPYSSGAANINTSFADDHQLTDTDDIHIEGIPTGWTAKDKKNTPVMSPASAPTESIHTPQYTNTPTQNTQATPTASISTESTRHRNRLYRQLTLPLPPRPIPRNSSKPA